MPLPEQRRQQLDNIVSKMEANNEPEDNIRLVVQDFQKKYENESAANFSTTNEKDAQGNAVVDGPMDALKGAFNTGVVGTVKGIGAMGEAAQAGLKVFGGMLSGNVQAVQDGAQTLRQMGADILEGQTAVKKQADAAWDAGDRVTAMRKYADWLLPVIGPALDRSADKAQQGQVWRAAGEAVGLAGTIALPEALKNAQIKVPAVGASRNPVEAAAVQFGEERGVPIDAATATGNPYVRNIQKSVGNTPVGSIPAMRGQAAQAESLTRVGRELADQVYPESVVPEQAGEGLRQSLNFQVRKFHGKASEAYDTLRRYESDPELAERVPSPEAQAQRRAVDQEAARSVGKAPTEAEWSELRRMREELAAMPYSEGGLVPNKYLAEGEEQNYVRRGAGAPVYHDIVAASPGTSEMSRAEVQTSIEQALASGRFTNAAKGALEVARKRLSGSWRVSPATLPEGAGAVETPTVSMLLPADVRTAKEALRPVYDRIMRRLPVTQQRSSPGLKAIENIINGPDFAPITELDEDLSAIKALARGADLPELKDVSQGLASRAVAELDRSVRAAATKAGPDAVKALESGRAATRAKYAVSDVLRDLRDEPVQAFGQAVYANDAGINRLRGIAKYAPAELPRIGRAYVEDLLTKATADGGFSKAKTVASAWERLGPQTKALLFEPQQAKALDNYFRLAKMIAENPNPSGSGLVVGSMAGTAALMANPLAGAVANLSAGALSKLLYSPKAVRLFTKGTTVMLGPGRTSAAMRAAGIADVVAAMREAGVANRLAPAAEDDTASSRPAMPQAR